MSKEHPDLSDVDKESGFDSFYGLVIDALEADEVRAHVAVSDHHKQPVGLVHGGVYASIAESVASRGTWVGVAKEGFVALGMSNHTTFLRSINQGTIHAVARPIHKGSSTWVWDVEISDDDDRICAVSRMTIAVRPQRV